MFRSRDDFKPQAISRIIMMCVRAVYERPVKVCGTHVSCGVVYDPPCAQDAVLFAWVSRLSSTSREFTTFCTGLSLSVQLSADSTQVCRPVRSRHSAVRSPQRWASAVALAGGRVVLHAALYRLQYRLRLRVTVRILYARYRIRYTYTRLFTLPCLNTACASLSTRSTRRRTISTSAPGTTRDTHTRRFLGLRYALVFAARGGVACDMGHMPACVLCRCR